MDVLKDLYNEVRYWPRYKKVIGTLVAVIVALYCVMLFLPQGRVVHIVMGAGWLGIMSLLIIAGVLEDREWKREREEQAHWKECGSYFVAEPIWLETLPTDKGESRDHSRKRIEAVNTRYSG